MSQPDVQSMQLKLRWLFLADNYRNIGEKGRAYEVVKDLVAFSSETDDLSELEERYRHHLMEWEEFSASAENNGRYKRKKK